MLMMMMMKNLLLCGWQFNIDVCCNSHLPVATNISLPSRVSSKLVAYISREIPISLYPSASAIRKSGSMAVQFVKAVPKYVNYKAVGS